MLKSRTFENQYCNNNLYLIAFTWNKIVLIQLITLGLPKVGNPLKTSHLIGILQVQSSDKRQTDNKKSKMKGLILI